MKNINKYSYNEANENVWLDWYPDSSSSIQQTNSFFQSDPYPFNQYFPPGMVTDRPMNLDRLENHQRDGKDFEEFKRFKRRKRLNRLRKLLKLKKMKSKKNVFTPAPFYSSEYGYTGFEGARTSPLEYYSGSIMDEPGAITNNPYNNTWQGNSYASSRIERIKIRSMIFNDYLIKS